MRVSFFYEKDGVRDEEILHEAKISSVNDLESLMEEMCLAAEDKEGYDLHIDSLVEVKANDTWLEFATQSDEDNKVRMMIRISHFKNPVIRDEVYDRLSCM